MEFLLELSLSLDFPLGGVPPTLHMCLCFFLCVSVLFCAFCLFLLWGLGCSFLFLSVAVFCRSV